MTIKNNLTNLVNARKEIIKVINDKGVSCPTTTKLAQIPPYINSIQSNSWGGDSSTLQEIYDNTSTAYYLTWAGSPFYRIYKEVSFSKWASVIFVILKNDTNFVTVNAGGVVAGGIFGGAHYYHTSEPFSRDAVKHNIAKGRKIILFIEPYEQLNDWLWTPTTIFLIPTFVEYNNYKIWFPTNEDNRVFNIEKDSVFVYGLNTGSTQLDGSFGSTNIKIYDENKNLVLDASTKGKEVKIGKLMVKKGYSVRGYSGSFGICYW